MKGLEPHPCIVYLVWITVVLCHSRSNEVCPLHSWLCGFRSSLRDALKRFTRPTTVRPLGLAAAFLAVWLSILSERCTQEIHRNYHGSALGPRPSMYPSDVLHLILACFYTCSCFCDLFCTCCSPHPSSLPLPSFPSNCQAGHTPLRVW